MHPDQSYYNDPKNYYTAAWQNVTGQKFNADNNLMHAQPGDNWTDLNKTQFFALLQAMTMGMVNKRTVDNKLDVVR